MRFSEQHEVNRPEGSDWFDANVEMDSPLYVDPLLLFEDEDPAWEGAHEEILDFFDATLELLKQAQGHRDSMHWAKAKRFLQFPELREFALGMSMGHPEGSGIGPELALEMCEGLEFFRERGRGSDDQLLAMIAVLVPGIGVDRISDMVCNILKGRFIAYTQEICRGLGISLEEVAVANPGGPTGADGCRARWRCRSARSSAAECC